MNDFFALALCFLPYMACLVCFKVLAQTRLRLLLVSSLLGLLVIIPSSFFQLILFSIRTSKLDYNIQTLFVSNIVKNGFVEEIFKMAFLFMLPKKKLNFKEFFICSIVFGICIGCFETFVYYRGSLYKAQSEGATLIYHLIFIRMFTSDLIHTFCSALCGIFVWSVKEKKIDPLTIVFAVMMHGLFDFFMNLPSEVFWMRWLFGISALLFAIIECRVHYEKNRPEEIYEKVPSPESLNPEVTVESPLMNAPTYKGKPKRKSRISVSVTNEKPRKRAPRKTSDQLTATSTSPKTSGATSKTKESSVKPTIIEENITTPKKSTEPNLKEASKSKAKTAAPILKTSESKLTVTKSDSPKTDESVKSKTAVKSESKTVAKPSPKTESVKDKPLIKPEAKTVSKVRQLEKTSENTKPKSESSSPKTPKSEIKTQSKALPSEIKTLSKTGQTEVKTQPKKPETESKKPVKASTSTTSKTTSKSTAKSEPKTEANIKEKPKTVSPRKPEIKAVTNSKPTIKMSSTKESTKSAKTPLKAPSSRSSEPSHRSATPVKASSPKPAIKAQGTSKPPIKEPKK